MERFVHMLLQTVKVSAVAAAGSHRGMEALGSGLQCASPGYVKVGNSAMRLLVACVAGTPQMATYICTFGSIREWLADTVVHTQNADIRQVVCQGVVKIAIPNEDECLATRQAQGTIATH